MVLAIILVGLSAWLLVIAFCVVMCIAAAREDRLRERLAHRAQLELVTLERQERVDDYEDYRGV